MMSHGKDDSKTDLTDQEKYDFEWLAEEAKSIAEESVPAGSTVLVVSDIAPGRDDIEEDYAPIRHVGLPLVPLPPIHRVRTRLLAECPHAEEAIDQIVNDLVGQSYVVMPPTLLVGPPGCGKNHLATMLARALGLPLTVYSCAAAGDATLVGASRYWNNGGPSLPLQRILQSRIASPCILLDELDKAATSRNNGRLPDALLPLLEASTAKAYHDPWLQADVDLSGVVWLAVANEIEPLSAPLRDRLRILTVPPPGPEHLQPLANAMLNSEASARGIAPPWSTPLDPAELASLEAVWRGGSLRALRRYVRAVLKTRFDPASALRH